MTQAKTPQPGLQQPGFFSEVFSSTSPWQGAVHTLGALPFSRVQPLFWLAVVVIGWTIGYDIMKVQLATDISPRPMFLAALRFGLAGLILLSWASLNGQDVAVPRAGLGWLQIQACLLFVLQYVGMYLAAPSLSAPMLAILFSATVLMNLPLAWLLLGQRPGLLLILAACGSFVGLVCILWPGLRASFANTTPDVAYMWALLAAFSGTLGLTLGTLAQTPLSARTRGVGTRVTTGWAMLIGAGLLLGLAALRGESFDLTGLPLAWWASLGGLALFSSALPFLGFLILVDRWGAGTASLTMLLPPVLSLILSTFINSGQTWELGQIAGLGLVLLGNAVVLRGEAKLA